MRELFASGKIEFAIGKVPLLKRYLDEMKGKPIQDIWADVPFNYQKKGRFPTQKPEALLERIINGSSNPNQIIYEAFAGSSTGGVVCYKLSRRWIGSEISQDACNFTINRLGQVGCKVRLYSKSLLEASSSHINSSDNLAKEIHNVYC